MKWQEGLAIAGALSNNPGIAKATSIPLAQRNNKKQNDAIKEFNKGWSNDYA
tara:strand:+ start:669 stop:824 length:156 start_codon:yes stop_codon:yes gene_type:complete